MPLVNSMPTITSNTYLWTLTTWQRDTPAPWTAPAVDGESESRSLCPLPTGRHEWPIGHQPINDFATRNHGACKEANSSNKSVKRPHRGMITGAEASAGADERGISREQRATARPAATSCLRPCAADSPALRPCPHPADALT